MNKLEAFLDSVIKNKNFKVALGFEFEFYLVDKLNQPIYDAENFISEIQKISTSNNFLAYVDEEESIGQVEISSIANFEIIETLNNWEKTLKDLKSHFSNQNIFINHEAKPFLNKSGNGLHINISLHDPITLENLFGKDDQYRSDIKNELMAYSIGGLLQNIEKNIDQYLFNESTINRIRHHDRNTPINYSWGQNNRTAMIRIPESLPYAKRVENRLPSAENDIYSITFLTLQGIFYGIENKISPPQCTYGLAFDSQYNLKNILSQ